jgi:hypothetical protein
MLQPPGVAIGHPPHAKYEIGIGPADGAGKTRGKPVGAKVEGLERAMRQAAQAPGEGASRAERHQLAGVAGANRGAGKLDGLALGSPAAQVVLED